MLGVIIPVAAAQLEAPWGIGNGRGPCCPRGLPPVSQRMSESTLKNIFERPEYGEVWNLLRRAHGH